MLSERKKSKAPKSQGFFKRNNLLGRMELACSYRHIDLLDWLVNIECAFQCNISSLSGTPGRSIHSAATHLCNQRIYTHYETDAHSLDDIEKIVHSSHKVALRRAVRHVKVN